LKRFALCLLGLLIASDCLFADNLQWGGTYLSAWAGFGTSPYTAINTSDNNKVLTIFCLDFNDEIAPPVDWVANIRQLTPSNVSTYGQFGGNYGMGITAAPFAFTGDTAPDAAHSVDLAASPTAYSRYLEAAWLFSNILAAQPSADVDTSVISQVAAWDLFVEGPNLPLLTSSIQSYNNPNTLYTFNNYVYSNNNYATAPTTSTMSGLQFEDAVDEALSAAQNAVVNEGWATSGYMANWNLVTGDPVWAADNVGRPVQEFLTDPPPIPEPSAMILLGTALVALGLVKRRKAA
jgi:hypothetical protein